MTCIENIHIPYIPDMEVSFAADVEIEIETELPTWEMLKNTNAFRQK